MRVWRGEGGRRQGSLGKRGRWVAGRGGVEAGGGESGVGGEGLEWGSGGKVYYA